VILFLEEKGESPYKLDRMLTHLLLSKRLEGVSALVIGQIEDCGEKEVIHDLLEERLRAFALPVATGLPVGHGAENRALPLGIPAVVDTEGMVLRIEEPAVY
jgi:muramoyltetrapeptide carboxypeptidase